MVVNLIYMGREFLQKMWYNTIIGGESMTFLLELINTFIYILCVINIGEGYLGYKRKHSQYRKIILLIAVLCTTAVMAYAGSLFLSIICSLIASTIVKKICPILIGERK